MAGAEAAVDRCSSLPATAIAPAKLSTSDPINDTSQLLLKQNGASILSSTNPKNISSSAHNIPVSKDVMMEATLVKGGRGAESFSSEAMQNSGTDGNNTASDASKKGLMKKLTSLLSTKKKTSPAKATNKSRKSDQSGPADHLHSSNNGSKGAELELLLAQAEATLGELLVAKSAANSLNSKDAPNRTSKDAPNCASKDEPNSTTSIEAPARHAPNAICREPPNSISRDTTFKDPSLSARDASISKDSRTPSSSSFPSSAVGVLYSSGHLMRGVKRPSFSRIWQHLGGRVFCGASAGAAAMEDMGLAPLARNGGPLYFAGGDDGDQAVDEAYWQSLADAMLSESRKLHASAMEALEEETGSMDGGSEGDRSDEALAGAAGRGNENIDHRTSWRDVAVRQKATEIREEGAALAESFDSSSSLQQYASVNVRRFLSSASSRLNTTLEESPQLLHSYGSKLPRPAPAGAGAVVADPLWSQSSLSSYASTATAGTPTAATTSTTTTRARSRSSGAVDDLASALVAAVSRPLQKLLSQARAETWSAPSAAADAAAEPGGVATSAATAATSASPAIFATSARPSISATPASCPAMSATSATPAIYAAPAGPATSAASAAPPDATSALASTSAANRVSLLALLYEEKHVDHLPSPTQEASQYAATQQDQDATAAAAAPAAMADTSSCSTAVPKDLSHRSASFASHDGHDPLLCCVCLVGRKGAAFIPCGHTFCRSCTKQLFAERGACPLCNNLIVQVLDIF